MVTWRNLVKTCWCAEVSFQMESAYFWAYDCLISSYLLASSLSHLPFLQHPHPGLWRRRPGARTSLLSGSQHRYIPLHVHSLLLFKHALSGSQLGSTWGCTPALKTTVPRLLRLVFRCAAETLLMLIFLLGENWLWMLYSLARQCSAVLIFLCLCLCLRNLEMYKFSVLNLAGIPNFSCWNLLHTYQEYHSKRECCQFVGIFHGFCSKAFFMDKKGGKENVIAKKIIQKNVNISYC